MVSSLHFPFNWSPFQGIFINFPTLRMIHWTLQRPPASFGGPPKTQNASYYSLVFHPKPFGGSLGSLGQNGTQVTLWGPKVCSITSGTGETHPSGTPRGRPEKIKELDTIQMMGPWTICWIYGFKHGGWTWISNVKKNRGECLDITWEKTWMLVIQSGNWWGIWLTLSYVDLLFLVIKGLLSLLNKNNASQKGWQISTFGTSGPSKWQWIQRKWSNRRLLVGTLPS